jgi:hypothetical protein
MKNVKEELFHNNTQVNKDNLVMYLKKKNFETKAYRSFLIPLSIKKGQGPKQN